MEQSKRPAASLFTWVHLSDIHIGHGDASYDWDQQLVLAELKRDIAKIAGGVANRSTEYDPPLPPPDALFVTGDLSFSGADRNPNEYVGVGELLREISTALSIDKQRIFI